MTELEQQYSKMVNDLSKPGFDIIRGLNVRTAHFWHMATGISGEAGELLDAVKKCAVYEKSLDIEHVVEELGDLEFYMQGLRYAIGVTREQCLEANMAKLEKRYASSRYSNREAQDRADKQ